jgi:WW domain
MNVALPPGWVKQWDSTSQQWYSVEQATGRTQWEPPIHMSQSYCGQPNTLTPPPPKLADSTASITSLEETAHGHAMDGRTVHHLLLLRG